MAILISDSKSKAVRDELNEQAMVPVGKVVVITGASSGIGRATALEFAERGYHVVLAARRKRELDKVATECREFGVEALVVPTDVTDELAVQQLAAEALQAFGSINLWVNNAGVSLYGKFLEVPTADFRQVLETNVMGYVYGCRAALEVFREQTYGTLVNVTSINAVAPVPYSSAYVASKYAIRGLGQSLRMELEVEGLDESIHICEVLPPPTDTNFFQNAANYMRRRVQAVEPVYEPMVVARQIASLANLPRREVVVGAASKLVRWEHALMPWVYEKTVGRYINANNFADEPDKASTGGLYTPVEGHTGTHGGWRQRRITSSAVGAMAALTGIAAVGVVTAGWIAGRRHRSR